MPMSAYGKYFPPYGASAWIDWPSISLEKKKNVSDENRMPIIENTKFVRYDAMFSRSRLTNAQTLRRIATPCVLRDDLREDLGQGRFTPRALEDGDPARDGERHGGGNGPLGIADGQPHDDPRALRLGRGIREPRPAPPRAPRDLSDERAGRLGEPQAEVLSTAQARADLGDRPGRQDAPLVDDPHEVRDLLGLVEVCRGKENG